MNIEALRESLQARTRAPVALQETGPRQVVQRHRDRLLGGVRDHRQAEQESVPDVRELEDADDDECRQRERQHDLPEDLDDPGAVDARGLDQLAGDVREVVAVALATASPKAQPPIEVNPAVPWGTRSFAPSQVSAGWSSLT